MRWLTRFWLIAGLLLAPLSAHAVIGTPTEVGKNAFSSVTQVVVTTSAAIPQGALIVVVAASSAASAAVSSIVDSGAVNSYSLIIETATDTSAISYGLVPNALALASGQTVTCNFSGTAGRHACYVFYVPGMTTNPSPADKQPATVATTGTSATTIASGVLTQSDEVLLGVVNFGGNTPGTFTQGGSFSLLGTTAASLLLQIGVQVVSSTSSVNWSPTWVNSVSYRSRLITFFGAGPSVSSRMLTGVGSQ